MAPEQFSKKPYDPFKAEIYSLGIFLFHLVFKAFPFEPNAGEASEATSTEYLYDFETSERNIHRVKPSRSFLDLLARMMAYNPEERICLEGIT